MIEYAIRSSLGQVFQLKQDLPALLRMVEEWNSNYHIQYAVVFRDVPDWQHYVPDEAFED